jgi:hypothetical protein
MTRLNLRCTLWSARLQTSQPSWTFSSHLGWLGPVPLPCEKNLTEVSGRSTRCRHEPKQR